MRSLFCSHDIYLLDCVYRTVYQIAVGCLPFGFATAEKGPTFFESLSAMANRHLVQSSFYLGTMYT